MTSTHLKISPVLSSYKKHYPLKGSNHIKFKNTGTTVTNPDPKYTITIIF